MWILVPAGDRELVTNWSCCCSRPPSLSHAWQQFGTGWALRFAVISAGFSLLIELLGHTTDIPFGPHDYTELLRPQILRRACDRSAGVDDDGLPVSCAGAASLSAGWFPWPPGPDDVGLLPRPADGRRGLLGLGTDPTRAAGIPGIPLQNYAGWLLGSLLLMWVLNRLPRQECALGVPLLLYGWMWIGGIIANAVFLDRPSVALVGGLGMAVLRLPALLSWWRR